MWQAMEGKAPAEISGAAVDVAAGDGGKICSTQSGSEELVSSIMENPLAKRVSLARRAQSEEGGEDVVPEVEVVHLLGVDK